MTSNFLAVLATKTTTTLQLKPYFYRKYFRIQSPGSAVYFQIGNFKNAKFQLPRLTGLAVYREHPAGQNKGNVDGPKLA